MASMQRSCAQVEKYAKPAAGQGRTLTSFRPLLPTRRTRLAETTHRKFLLNPPNMDPCQYKQFKVSTSEYQ
jgi:hypothetical protein